MSQQLFSSICEGSNIEVYGIPEEPLFKANDIGRLLAITTVYMSAKNIAPEDGLHAAYIIDISGRRNSKHPDTADNPNKLTYAAKAMMGGDAKNQVTSFHNSCSPGVFKQYLAEGARWRPILSHLYEAQSHHHRRFRAHLGKRRSEDRLMDRMQKTFDSGSSGSLVMGTGGRIRISRFRGPIVGYTEDRPRCDLLVKITTAELCALAKRRRKLSSE
ncbi:hypothetical protein BCR33DRAFT_786217 [Rhizoclosmatium globosum]|uniref:Uncharacterized protein n=1 Tax=Rhizoclosmatium globosum TaxID=329046 RepID=A0A1Y2C6G1_9FUNG|nr:hypothetical protein BCR33DRAFT_786217 [Rhizoclosmatium globosum]|eukprot:ORY42474.1 hypothetical protein BCR33DRAFT_786217 [Rhizoclosmatium globosum]